jgi:hypothetical protein
VLATKQSQGEIATPFALNTMRAGLRARNDNFFVIPNVNYFVLSVIILRILDFVV